MSTASLLATLSFCGNRVLELDEEDGLDALPSPGSYSGRGGESGLWWEALPHPHFQGRESARTAGQPQCLTLQGSAVPGSCPIPSSSDSTKGWSHLQSPEFLGSSVHFALRGTLLPLGPQTQLN